VDVAIYIGFSFLDIN